MGDAIYLIRGDEDFVPMKEHPYDSEEVLQSLLARYPDVLAGEQTEDGELRRWLLISREMPVPDSEGGAGRWAVDHLFVDQDGVPTIVEVKRSSDTRIRREVVGQMLDYAANAVVYWPLESLTAQFEATCSKANRDPAAVLTKFIGPESDPDGFWRAIKNNLEIGKLRLVFVADTIPPELRRVVEFLNGQMNRSEVLAVEVKQYVAEGLRTLVPRVIGQTAQAEATKGGRGPRWDEERFFVALSQIGQPQQVEVARQLLAFGAQVAGREVDWGTGKRGSFTARLVCDGERFSLFSVYTDGYFSFNAGWSYQRLGEELSEKYRAFSNDQLSVTFDRVNWERGWPRASLSVLTGERVETFKELVRQFAAEAQALGDSQ
ncbi:MAG: hypothetical protein HYY03_07025 [Chloroflexi bacterium]|nr:hypothetical protein [Chloroflexota bacterium]